MDERWDEAPPIHPLLAKRWSPRAFSERPVTDAELVSVLEAARWAPSSSNAQPWSFLVARRGEAGHEAMVECLNSKNLWAERAPVLILSVTNPSYTHPHKPPRENRHAFFEVGLAVANLVVQATALGLYAHHMAGFGVERARTLFRIPEGLEPVVITALGYLGDPATLDEDLRRKEERPRTRKALSTFVFQEVWGRPAPFLHRAS